MSLSDQDLRKYVGQSLANVQNDLESQGYKVYTVRIGRCSTGYIPEKTLHIGENAPKPEQRAIISYNGDDPQHPVISIRQD